MTTPDNAALLESFIRQMCDGTQVCCGNTVGGGMDENGNGEPPSCCGQPMDIGAELRRLLATQPCARCGELERDAARWRMWIDMAREAESGGGPLYDQFSAAPAPQTTDESIARIDTFLATQGSDHEA